MTMLAIDPISTLPKAPMRLHQRRKIVAPPRVAPNLEFLDPSLGIVVVSHSGGQDSQAMLMLLTDRSRPEFRDKYLGNRNLLVIHADTMNEHDETVEFRKWTAAFCREHRINYVTLSPSMGYHSASWSEGLLGQWTAGDRATVGSVTYPSTCSDQLKITPIYNYLAAVLQNLYGFDTYQKRAYDAYGKKFGEKIDVLIGFARGEESRAGRAEPDKQLDLIDLIMPKKETRPLWQVDNINKRFPLLDIGFNRADLQEYLKARNLPVPIPSLCKRCHWKSRAHVEAMRRFDPAELAAWLENEDEKISDWAEKCEETEQANSYIMGKIPLRQFIQEGYDQYGAWSDDDLKEHIFSHGHSVKTKQ